jgi:hypothetical protein
LKLASLMQKFKATFLISFSFTFDLYHFDYDFFFHFRISYEITSFSRFHPYSIFLIYKKSIKLCIFS